MSNNLIRFLILFGLVEILLAGSFWSMELAKSAAMQTWFVGIMAALAQAVLTMTLGIAIFGSHSLENDFFEVGLYVAFTLLVNFVSACVLNNVVGAGIGYAALAIVIFGLLTAYVCFMILVIAARPKGIPTKPA